MNNLKIFNRVALRFLATKILESFPYWDTLDVRYITRFDILPQKQIKIVSTKILGANLVVVVFDKEYYEVGDNIYVEGIKGSLLLETLLYETTFIAVLPKVYKDNSNVKDIIAPARTAYCSLYLPDFYPNLLGLYKDYLKETKINKQEIMKIVKTYLDE